MTDHVNAPVLPATTLQTVWIVQGTHFHNPGTVLKPFGIEAEAKAFAAELVNILRGDCNDDGLPQDATGDNFEAKLLEARRAQALDMGWDEADAADPDGNEFDLDLYLQHDNNDADVWVTEFEMTTPLVLPGPVVTALRNATGAIGALDEQMSQMEGLFDDEDGQIAEAREDGDRSCAEIAAVLAHFREGAPLPVPEIYIMLDGGLIQDVRSTGFLMGASYTTIDYDIEGTSDDTSFVDGEEACIGGGTVELYTSTITAEE